MNTVDNALLERASALKLYGLLSHWDEVKREAWVPSLNCLGRRAATGTQLAKAFKQCPYRALQDIG
jgi:hypothetical protein